MTSPRDDRDERVALLETADSDGPIAEQQLAHPVTAREGRAGEVALDPIRVRVDLLIGATRPDLADRVDDQAARVELGHLLADAGGAM